MCTLYYFCHVRWWSNYSKLSCLAWNHCVAEVYTQKTDEHSCVHFALCMCGVMSDYIVHIIIPTVDGTAAICFYTEV